MARNGKYADALAKYQEGWDRSAKAGPSVAQGNYTAQLIDAHFHEAATSGNLMIYRK